MSDDNNTDPGAEPRTFIDEFNDAITSISARAQKIGSSITEVCRRASVSRASPDRWRKKPPHTVDLVAKMQKTVAEMEKEAVDGET
jgi:transposase-like protein